MEFFNLQTKIKHADWPYIIQNTAIFFLLAWVGSLLIEGTWFQIYLAFLVIFYLAVTQFHIFHIQNEAREHQQHKIQCITTLHGQLPLKAPLPPMTGWAATPELAVTVLRIIQTYKPQCVLELGSGVTTIISGYSVEKFCSGGRVISLDHDAHFAEKTRDYIGLHSLKGTVDLRVAPLKKQNLNQGSWKWYSDEQLHFQNPIDLLIVDGPPFKTQKNARYPAIPLLYQYLNDKAVVIIHDTNRASESDSVETWLDEFSDLQAEKLSTEKGITILKKGY